jgi:hypothetical protein
MREVCAVYVERIKDRLYYRKKNGITVLFGTRLKTIWRSKILINLKIDADALNRRRRRFCVRRTMSLIYPEQRR